MTLADIKKLPLHITATVNAETTDEKTHFYIVDCLLNRFYNGDYGEVDQEDTDANNRELAEGEGKLLARYKAKYKLEEDIYICARFSKSMPESLDANHVLIMYCSEW